jgi:hypothetical protein
MKCLRLAWWGGKLALFAVGSWLAAHGTALAQQPPEKPAEAPGGSYVASYAIVILAIALGLLVVCRPSRRRDRAKPEVYDEIKMGAKE